MRKESVLPKMAYRLLNPGCVVLVSAGDGERDGLFALTWNMPVRKSPGTVALLSGKRHYTYGIIERTRELGISVPDASIVDAVYGCGSTTGHRGVDKWERFGLTRQQAEKTRVPLVEQAVATLECRVEQVVDMGPSALIIAEIVAARAAPEHFDADGAWCFDHGLQLIHHLGGAAFGVTDRVVRAKAR